MKTNLDYTRVLKNLNSLYNTGKSAFKLSSFYLGEKIRFSCSTAIAVQTFKESLLQYALHIHGSCICGFKQLQNENILKTPESSKTQNLNLLCACNYLHSTSTVLCIISNFRDDMQIHFYIKDLSICKF